MSDMTVAEAAGILGVSERTMRRWIREGRLVCYRVGGRVRIPERSVREAAIPYGKTPIGDRPSPTATLEGLDDPRRALDAQVRRATAAFEVIDRIRVAMPPPAGPEDSAEGYIRHGRDEMDEKWDRLLGFEHDPRR